MGGFSNEIFNVNGRGDELLLKALELKFAQCGRKCEGWKQSKKSGLILTWCGGKGINIFPAKMTASECVSFVSNWLKGDFAKTVELAPWCGNADHDGHNEDDGWQVYCNDWGHVEGWEAICGIRPAYIWYGK